jgi:diaminopimelate decarboxylase
VRDIAERFGTPCFVYEAQRIAQRIADLARFDVVRYAVKALGNLAVLDLVRRHGCLVDTVSAGEIERALAAGFAPGGEPPPIVYTADLFDHDALRLCVERGIHVNCGSPDMIDQLGERAAGREITLRINPGFGHGHSRKTNTGGEHSKHGIWHEQLDDCAGRARRRGLTICGLHMHIGSGTDVQHLSRVAEAMEKSALQVGDSVRTISCGGGLPVPYREGEQFVDLDAYYRLWDATRGRLADAFGHPVRLEIEPGRYLVAESGFLVTEIRSVKKQGRNTFYIVDAGFNNLARPVLYGAYHAIAIVPASGRPGEGPLHEVVVGGPLCESGDIFTQEEGGTVAPRPLPLARVGDLLVIQCCGAYGSVMGSNYCSKVFPAEVLIEDGQALQIRQRQPLEDLFRLESIPKRSGKPGTP